MGKLQADCRRRRWSLLFRTFGLVPCNCCIL